MSIRLLLSLLAVAPAALAQSTTEPPASQHIILNVRGIGAQIYTCQQSSGTPQWIFKAPEADLVDEAGNTVGSHSAGPTWKSTDGSQVKGELLEKSTAPEANAVPWLLLKAASTSGTGTLSKAEYIRRWNTHGGTAPTSGCDAGHLGQESSVPYTATYTFYSGKP